MNPAKETRVIDGKTYTVTRLPAGRGGQSISKQFFGGRKGLRGRSINKSRGQRESYIERIVVK
jgi:hypothetical protein